MASAVLFFDEVDRNSLPLVGGKGANLGEMAKAGLPVPGGFCVTTSAYKEFVGASPKMDGLLNQLNNMDPGDLDLLRQLGKQIRTHLLQIEIPANLRNGIIDAWQSVGKEYSYAIRSSATAEDLPTASFAGQQDTYLNIKGKNELLMHVRKCWASLFTDRAISYRTKNGFDHSQVYLSVVVQRMVNPDVSGIMFTADPASGNRNVTSIDASFGLGEAIVSGMVSADLYKVKHGEIIQKNIAEKKLAIFSLPGGGTETKNLPADRQTEQALADYDILRLAELGKKIERHFGAPQDIEFCLENGTVFVVQSRPITSLYPLPDIPEGPLRVMVSFGHIQMMTDAIRPLGISVLQTVFPKKYFLEAGGRLFIDLTGVLRTGPGRRIVPKALTNMDETISRAVSEAIQRPEFLKSPSKKGLPMAAIRILAPIMKEALKNLYKRDPQLAKGKVEDYINEKWKEVHLSLQQVSGTKRLEAVRHHLSQLVKDVLIILPYPSAFMIATLRLKRELNRLMGTDHALHQLTKSLPGNIMSEMGMQIGDLADQVRNLPEVEAYLRHAEDKTFYEGLSKVSGGEGFKASFQKFIDRYGMRGAGEIDISSPRWREKPTLLVSAILGHVRTLKQGEHRKKFKQGEQEALASKQEILHHAGRLKEKRLNRLIEVYRYMGGLREHHKHLITIVFDECKTAILDEAETLVRQGILRETEDVYFLTLDELILLSKGELNKDVTALIEERKEQHARNESLTQPRVVTSEGEILTGAPRQGKFPPGALVGSPVSAGVAEGRARIVSKPENAHLNEGEILVAHHTDPGWTPLFQTAKALVTEAGGLMTHGSVVAREYGMPAVVGLDEATKRIKDGQLIRVDGDLGIVEIISEETE
ncbi:phosphoenolpyruvate synthase [Bacillus marinisedimentorum]|uniref:phosphoenolpyruvate synthase n=1 Tax=Bacillus marinisedimentorum TaxID=1821260 RepID=UPI0008720D04|nr:phosphoenolpyruvate synthase [Bacillus marinisedimentorum]